MNLDPVAIPSEARLADAFEHAAARFRGTGLLLALLDDTGTVLLHDEAADDLATLLPALSSTARELPRMLPCDAPIARSGIVALRLAPGHVLALLSSRLTSELLLSLACPVRDTLLDRLAADASTQQLDGLTSQLADTYEELSLLYTVTGGMLVSRSPDEFFRNLCSDLAQTLGTSAAGAVLRPGGSVPNSLVVHGQLALDPARLARFVDETTELLVDHEGPLLLNELHPDHPLHFLTPDLTQLLAVPLGPPERLVGFLFATDKDPAARGSTNPGLFDSVDAKLLASVASASGVYLENSLLYEEQHGLLMGLLHALTSAIDAKDAYTCGHSERVALLSRLLARQAGFSDEQADRVYIAGLLHDVGKIGVPEAVLQKVGKLTPEEFAAMKTHPAIGARILENVRQVADCLPGVLHHHERFDGKGYPANLAADDIPLLARIICLADSFDAMTSNRTYRRGMPYQQALDEIARCSGTQFDPALAAHFLAIGADTLSAALDSHRARSTPVHLPQRPSSRAA